MSKVVHTNFRQYTVKFTVSINILRILYNNRPNKLSAHEIALEIDKHHLAITNAMKKLKPLGYVSYNITDKRYYCIEEIAISKFFTSN